MVRQLHERVRVQIEKMNRLYASKVNKAYTYCVSNLVIGFGCTCIRNDSLTMGNQSYSLVVMVRSKF
jgi:hypothetical protein